MTGDRVVLRHVTAFLEQRYECAYISFARRENARKAINVILHRLPLELAPYWSNDYRFELRAALSSQPVDQVFILHEGLFYLADEIDVKKIPVTLFAHNMLSRFSINSPAQPVLTALSRRYERRWYGKEGVRLVLISRGDMDEAIARGISGADTAIAFPGAPPSVQLNANAVFTSDAIITGTYGWWRKRRDLRSFSAAAAKLDLTAFDPDVAEFIPNVRIVAAGEAFDWSNAIRVGIITDRFSGGFKLKSLEYIAHNCIVFSRTPLLEEFGGLPHAEEFVVDRLDETSWPDRISAFKAEPQDALRERFLAFKAACLLRFDWEICLQALLPSGVQASLGLVSSNGATSASTDRLPSS